MEAGEGSLLLAADTFEDQAPDSTTRSLSVPLARTAYAGSLGERATLVQFSSAFCAPCRVTRVVLDQVAAAVPGIRHVEIDAELHLDLVRRAGVLRTPTTLVLDAAGRERSRASGAPSRDQVIAALSFLEAEKANIKQGNLNI